MTTEIEAVRMIQVDCRPGPMVVVGVGVVVDVVGEHMDVVEEITIMTGKIQIMALKSGVLRKVEEDGVQKSKIHLLETLSLVVGVVVEVVPEVVAETEVVGEAMVVVLAGGRIPVVSPMILAGVAVKRVHSPVAAEGGDCIYDHSNSFDQVIRTYAALWMYNH